MTYVQLPMFEPDTDWTPPEVFPDWNNADMVAIDLETKDPRLEDRGPGWPYRDGHIAGIALGFLQGADIHTCYLPIGHEGGGNIDKRRVLDYVGSLCDSRIPKVFHNALYDIGWLGTEGVRVRGPLRDTMYGAALLDENRHSYSLDNVAKDWIGEGKNEKQLLEAAAVWGFKTAKLAKKNLWRLPAKHVGPYAEQDTGVTLKLWRYEQELLERDGIMELAELEFALIPMLYEMRKRGIRVDVGKAEPLERKLVEDRKVLISEIHRDYGVHVEPWVASSLAKLFDAQNLKYNRTKTGLPSFTKDFLGGHPHPVAGKILNLRKLDTTINTFIRGQVLGAVNGRIHTELHSLKSDDGGTVTGRFSSSNPNLQQTSARDPVFGPLVRGLFLPEEGELWGSLDYASQEPRLTVHYAYLTHQEGSEEAVRAYNENPNLDYHGMVAELANIERKPAKVINLGLAYGMGEVKLCYDLGLPTEWIVLVDGVWVSADGPHSVYPSREIAGAEGKALIAKYHQKVPFIKGLTTTCSNLAGDRGWIRTLGGRLCRFDFWEPYGARKPAIQGRSAAAVAYPSQRLKRAYTHKAMNRLIQGSAADQTKKAMLMMYQAGILPMLQMHDELCLTVSESKEWKIAQECMIEAHQLEVPVVVDCEFGTTWGDATHEWKDLQ